MRAKFREKDLGNTGELTMDEMGELLREMREQARARKRAEQEALERGDPLPEEGEGAGYGRRAKNAGSLVGRFAAQAGLT